eukprot:m.191217 g.191217  ORF g.191217 m.191217 type:complete len:74 (-) comp14835_c1_seq6:734-955(-)
MECQVIYLNTVGAFAQPLIHPMWNGRGSLTLPRLVHTTYTYTPAPTYICLAWKHTSHNYAFMAWFGQHSLCCG